MTNPEKETIWITIPDEKAPDLQVSGKASEKAVSNPLGKVRNKAFWAIGFAALIIFFGLLLAPQQFAGLMTAQLFDGTFKVVPDFEQQTSGALFGGESSVTESSTTTTTTGSGTIQDENVVSAESEAVSIQIEPLSDPDNGAITDTNGISAGASATEAEAGAVVTAGPEAAESGDDEAESVEIDPETGELKPVAGDDTSETGETLDANAAFLQSLSKQLEEFKEKEKQNEQMIQDLMNLLKDQANGAHPAGTTGTNGTTGFLPEGQAGYQDAQGGISFGAGTGFGGGVYRYNTHTVTVSPYDVLAQNRSIQQASYQANVTYPAVQPYSQQSYNAVLSGVQGQPDTGPKEVMLFAFALSSLGVLVWGVKRAMQA